jgi:hypothetical protein
MKLPYPQIGSILGIIRKFFMTGFVEVGLIIVLIVLATAFLGVWLVRTLAPLFHKGRRGPSCCSQKMGRSGSSLNE